MNPKILLVSAWWPECEQLALWCGANRSQPLAAGETLECAQKDALVVCTGIGVVAAAVCVTRVLADYSSIESVVFCGTAGHYNKNVSAGSVFFSAESVFSDAGVVQNKSYFPPHRDRSQKLFCSAFADSHFVLPVGVQNAKCLTVPAITEAPDLCTLFLELAELEHLEFHGIAAAAQSAGKKWAGFFGVSNTVGPDSHAQWKKNHLQASLGAQTALYAAIFGGG